jgi:glutathione S-transferase
VTSALTAVDAMIDQEQTCLLLGRLTKADVTAFIAERLGRVIGGIDTESQMPRLRALTRGLAEQPAFRATEPEL